MDATADIVLLIATIGACLYCVILSKRLNKFTNLEKGVGGAIALLSVQVEDMTKTLRLAQTAASTSTDSLSELTGRAEAAAQRLELFVASMHDLPIEADDPVTSKKGNAGQQTAFKSKRGLKIE